MCFTDTLRRLAFVFDQKMGLIAVDKYQKVLFQVFSYDIGPDLISEGLFRIISKKYYRIRKL